MSALLPLLFFLLLLQPFFSTANVHKLNQLKPELISETPSFNATPPTLYFEVTQPIPVPKTKPCSQLILQHDFAYTYGKAPVFADYAPPSDCPSQKFSKIVLEWTATSKGRQFDRIFGVWLSGVELLRSCTAEPRTNGIVWSVEKDITRYYSLLQKNQTLAVYLGNLVDSTYTGVYHVNISFHFYPAAGSLNSYDENVGDLASGYHSWADLILPISRNLPLTDGLWFEVENSTDTELKEFKIPQNAYRAVLEVFVSFHENDEFWYSNPTNEYIAANNLSGTPGNGPFREVVVSLDGVIVGAVWPFTVVFTGGINPLLWRPITAIGSYDLPSYDIEITPFLGNILDGKSHKVGFNVTNALNVWYIDANLHIWLDKQSTRTEALLVKHTGLPLVVSVVSDFVGLNGTFMTRVSRSVSSTGWVKSSIGNITTQSIQDFSYINKMVMGNDGNLQTVNQNIHFNDTVLIKTPDSDVHCLKSSKTFTLSLYTDFLEQEDGTYLLVTNVGLGFIEKKTASGGPRLWESSLRNLQNAEGNMVVKNNLVVSGVGNTQQVYRYHGEKFCYFRNVSSSNYTILYDEVEKTCQQKDPLLVKAARGDPVSRPPAWMMRQAGRYMAVYRKLAEKYPSFRERSETTDLIVEISLQPCEAFRPDGVIIFSDILTPLPAFGVPFDIEDVRGPVIQSPITTEEGLKTLHPIDFDKLHFVGESLKILRREVGGNTAVLGFVGAPWTIATYIVEGGSTSTYTTIKSMCHTAPHVLRALLSHLTQAIADYIVFQVDAGAHCIQIFDSWGGQLPPAMWESWSKPYIEEIVSSVRKRCPETPLVLYINGNGGILERMKGTGVDVIGLDWTVDMADGRKRLGSEISVQGNVDPAYLFSPLPTLTEEIQRVVRSAGPRGHILNLGHGVLQRTPEEAVKHFFEVARSLNYDTFLQTQPEKELVD